MAESLLVIDDWINNILNPKKYLPKQILLQDILKCFDLISKEEEKLKKQLKREFIYSKSAECFTHRIHIYQQETIKSANTLLKYINVTTNKKLKKGYSQILNIFEELLIYLDTSYPEYFNRDVELTAFNKSEVRKFLKYNLAILQNHAGKYNIEDQLMQSVTSTIEKYCRETKDSILTFQLADYFRQIFPTLFVAIENAESKCKNQAVVDVIFDFNFNSSKIFEYLVNKIDYEMEKVQSHNEKIHLIYELRNEINKKIIHKPHLTLNIVRKTIKEQLLTFLDEEIAKNKTSDQAGLKSRNNKRIVSKKLLTDGNVEIIGYVARKCHERGFFPGSNVDEIMSTIALYFRTKWAHNISPESLRKKSYTKNKKIIRIAKSSFFILIKEMNKDLIRK